MLVMKSSTGKVKCAVKTSEFLSIKKKCEIFKVKFQKVPQVRESKRYEFLKAIQPIYQNYLVKVAVQPRTGIYFYENVISVFFFPQVSVIEKFKQCLYKLKA